MPDVPTKDVGRSPDRGYLPNLTPAISPTSANKTFSLTPAERIHLDIYGYVVLEKVLSNCLLYTSPSPRDVEESRMPSSA